jgi:hypothetical protein
MAWTAPRTWVVGEVVTAALINTHLRDNDKILGRDVEPFRHVGTTNMELWYPCGQGDAANAGMTDSSAFTADVLQAVPFIAPRNSTIDRIAFEQVGTSVGNARCGIYKTVSDTNMYPGALVVDGGQFDTDVSAAVKSSTINTPLPDCYYWAVFLYGGAGAPTFRRLLQTKPLLGFASTLGTTPLMFGTRSQTYGALPSTFPASPFTSLAGGGVPLIAIRFSA